MQMQMLPKNVVLNSFFLRFRPTLQFMEHDHIDNKSHS